MDLIHILYVLFYPVFVSFLCAVLATNTIEQTTQVIELYTNLPEERPVGQVVMRLAEELERHDRQAQRNYRLPSGNTRFHLLPTHDASLFHINTDGSLVIAKRLDYEELCDSTRLTKRVLPTQGHLSMHETAFGRSSANTPLCQLHVRVLILQTAASAVGTRKDHRGDKGENSAGSAGSQRQLRTIAIKITLLDTNDNRPTCTLSRPRKLETSAYSNTDWINVAENTPIGTVIAKWKLSDRDTMPNGITDARLFGTKNGKSTLLSSGELPFRLQFDQTMGPWSVVDLKLVLTKSVEYIDQQEQQQQQISRDYSDELDVYNLKIVILDSKETHASTSPTGITVGGGGVGGAGSEGVVGLSWNAASLSSAVGISCHLQVRITDINDHNPVWISPVNFVNGQPFELELTESKSYAQRELLRLKAIDADRGPNARIAYHWAPRNHLNLTNELSLNSVADTTYQELVSRLFYLDAATGSLQLRGTNVDFESISRLHPREPDSIGPLPGRLAITLRVIASDQPVNQSEQRLSPVGIITVWLLDVNDNSPHIQIIGLHSAVDLPEFPFPLTNTPPIYPQIVYIAENLPINEPVAFITVTDEDSEAHGGLACTLHQSTADRMGSELQAFQLVKLTQQTGSEDPTHTYLLPDTLQSIDATRSINYKLITTQSLDRERMGAYHLNLTCRDSLINAVASNPGAQLTAYRTIEVVVTDRNDNHPRIVGVIDRFMGKINTSTTPAGAFVCTVREHAPFGTKICQLRAEDLDQTGTGAGISSATASNNNPLTGREHFQWWIEDSVRPLIDVERETGWLVVQSQLQPVEQQQYQQQQHPKPNPSESVHNRRTEVIMASSQLDREVLTELSFTVYVQDTPQTKGENRLTASATVLLRILDINDHVPKISEYNYFQISEAAVPGTVIGNLVALDGDEPDNPNSALTYHIYSHGDGIDPTGRELTVLNRSPTDSMMNELRDIKTMKISTIVRYVAIESQLLT
ncbi:unnamed protein product [Echinostoma caproni]|uniref:Cadherin domain-containing protein n=1 Tax=Echinostoma caproni TaxID=27848 RepID=A0A183AE45_9TREM|nr:unnamed protein product [Echinostoma caproni]